VIKVCIFFVTIFVLIADANPIKTKLDIYSNRAFVTKSFNIANKNYIMTQLPLSIKSSEVEILDDDCKIDDIKLFTSKKENKKILNIKNRIENLTSEIELQKAQLKLLSSISLKDRDIKEIKKILEFNKINFSQITNHISKLDKELEALKKRLEEMQAS
jgi:septal ring factor EnvC (AmiA/AmiB activator)